MIRVLIVEDSPVMQQMLIYTISSDTEMKIVGVAHNGEEAIVAVNKLNPDVIAMDLNMPKLNGIDATKTIMATKPTPIVIVTGSITVKDQALSFKIIEAGALAILKKPPGIDHSEYKKLARSINQTLKLMSEIKLVRRINNHHRNVNIMKPEMDNFISEDSKIKLIAIGASTGGPIVIKNILEAIPKNIPVPILIVQHISQGFTKGFAEWLEKSTHFPIHIPASGDALKDSNVYLAPDNLHMGVGKDMSIRLSNKMKENGLRPSVSYLFRSIAENIGARSVGILLSGMGRDGADELKLLRDKGAYTFAQDKETSVVHGMPGEAIKLNAAMHILPPLEIAAAVSTLIKKINT